MNQKMEIKIHLGKILK